MKAITEQQSIVKKVLNDTAKFGFTPNKEFYEVVQVNRKRWVLLLNGKKEPTVTELKDICNYFGADIKKYI